jgi:hypothetical protein
VNTYMNSSAARAFAESEQRTIRKALCGLGLIEARYE